MKEFRTVFKEVQKEIVVNKSKFISNVKPVSSEEEALDFINQIKLKYWDATHNVYAYVLKEKGVQRYSDDGEPRGTAGIPTLQAIKDLDLQNVVVVTTRYFGGTLLGANGLIRAYRNSAKEGLLEAQIVINKSCVAVQMAINYNLLGKVQNEVLKLGYIISNITYEENVKLEILLPKEELDKLNSSIANVTAGETKYEMLGNVMVTLDLSGKLLSVNKC